MNRRKFFKSIAVGVAAILAPKLPARAMGGYTTAAPLLPSERWQGFFVYEKNEGTVSGSGRAPLEIVIKATNHVSPTLAEISTPLREILNGRGEKIYHVETHSGENGPASSPFVEL